MSKLLPDTKDSIKEWASPSDMLTLKPDEIHLWRAFLDLDESYLEALRQTLSGDEIERANRFHFQRDREHYIAGRGLLRVVLARYLETDAAQIRFCQKTHGKPALARECFEQSLCFNVSHSHGLALFAVARDRHIGIDVEHVRPRLADEHIIEQFFSQREIAALRSLPSHMQTEAFFSCWTRKEAYLKARGIGLALKMDQFDVPVHSVTPGSLAGAVQSHDGDGSRWAIWHLAPAPNYIGAVAAEDSACELKCLQFDLDSFYS
jgi:4'-phosphopantetheinyl transferase